jgi:site-specific DNA recombinase
MAKKKMAAIYPRKSRENAATLDGQINACIEWCDRNHVDYEIFAEEGSASSEDWNRPKLQEMIKGIENYEFDLVVVTEQTRICRDDMFPVFKQVLLETETLFVTADNNSIFDFANPDDELKSDILQAVGKNELSRTKIRLKRGTVQSAKKGNWQGKKAPTGYDYDHVSKRLKKNKDAEIVRRMFELYMNGNSTTQISHIFNVENVLAYHKKKGELVPITWSKSTIARSLKNIAYAGHTLFGKTKLKKIKGKKEVIKTEEEVHILIEDTHESIVNKEEWELVQQMITKKRNQPATLKHAKHIFSGLIACANCGTHHTFERQQDQNKEWRISSCKTRNHNSDFTKYKMCGNSGCKLDIIDKLFHASLKGIKEELEKYIDLIQTKRISDKDASKKKETMKNSKSLKIDALKKKRKNIISMLEDEMYEGEEINEKRQETKLIQNQIKILEKEIQEINTLEEQSEIKQIEFVLGNIEMFLTGKGNSKMSEKEKNEILGEFIQDIIYKKAGKSAEVQIEIALKENIQEMFNEVKEELRIAI